jgi:hypothetical protein
MKNLQNEIEKLQLQVKQLDAEINLKAGNQGHLLKLGEKTKGLEALYNQQTGQLNYVQKDFRMAYERYGNSFTVEESYLKAFHKHEIQGYIAEDLEM